MTLEIGLTLLVILITLVAFIREWAAPDVLALTILCLVVALKLVSPTEMMDVFRNEAPLTIAALFVIGGALERSGAVDHIGKVLKNKLSGNTRIAILAFSLLAAFFSAWMNNTAIVAILLPVTLGFARSKDIAPSRLLMPLSYSSILGGCCTLIGTSTNLLVNGSLKGLGEKPMGMFELAPIGLPMAVAGIGYLAIFGPKLIPARSSITGSLEIDHRTSPLHHLLIGRGSPIVGMKLVDTPLADRASGVHVMEIRRKGTRLMTPISKLVIEPNDRFLVALHRRRGGAAKAEELFDEIGAQVLSTVDGIVSELVIRDESSLHGKTLAASDFRQRYNCVVLAVHRDGINITSQIATLPLETGDTLLVITALNNLDSLKATRDFVLTDLPEEAPSQDEPKVGKNKHIIISWATLVGVVLVATLTDFLHPFVSWIPEIPIHYAALVGALLLLWLKIVTPREAYASVDWQVLLMLYGLLGLGMAMQNTGTAKFLSTEIVELTERFVSPEYLPVVLLWTVFLLTLILTEVLSNNATAVMMVPIVVTLAHELKVDSRPFVMGVTVAASTAFALPMGYQTHMMVFGPGGYKFVDFLKVGIPLNIICWIISCSLIPFIWPF
ncbi:SLC13 family permease [Luteolibacter sp. SL250]|uniref:SLC13 family permease n=1 Tax=Luteolibacter sp. SL250 TaxID=2995170 RepID=UPI00226E7313|nr:SLC13 family permease [Luteolibacter sp. SL250]WAC21631.1 SLC13 family permease [Luteolibacter sp. SL250]